MTQTPQIRSRKIINVPNILTMARIALSVVLFALFPFKLYITCLVLFIIAALTDYADGWWARRYDQKTQFGRIMDPFADKALVCGTYIYLVAVPELHNLFSDCASSCCCAKIPLGLATWMVVAILMRELFVTMLRSMVESSGGDFSAKWIGKWKTTLQCVNIPMAFLLLILDSKPCWLKVGFIATLYVVVYLTLYSGWIYIRAAMKMSRAAAEAKADSEDAAQNAQ
ncbi:MAG: CDP-alcohol phosphatidyltransferase family protein [Thermoguttaceae bacterium]|jgi:CDP-diacylglycerol--glycerol-3-phosphate 3-phosphatidyltransferase|nr:CDP-alcohol phosphatidyltransferase family protein [Thermoguttaceae bacterium]